MARTKGKTLKNSSNKLPFSRLPWTIDFHLESFLCIAFSLLLLVIFPATTMAGEVNLETILKGIEHRYAGQDFTANFYQTSRLAAIDITESAQGRAFFSHPGKMCWEYQEPEPQQIITNGKTLWIFRPEENQVIKGDAASFFKTGAGGSFLSDITQVRASYTITLGRKDADYVELILIPKTENPEISSIKIRVSPSNFEIFRIETENIYKDTTILEFKNIDFIKLDHTLFDFITPQGTDLLFMNGENS